MKIYAFVQARLNSSRLPGKVLLEVKGRPVLGYVADRIRRARELDGLVIATSRETSDDPIAAYCQREKIECFRGDLNDVALRFLEASKKFGPDAFVRISADSPWMDYRIIDEAANQFRTHRYDLVSNVVRRTYPKGESVEVIRTDTFQKAYPFFGPSDNPEFVTTYFYRNASQFRIASLALEREDFSKANLCVDDRESFEIFSQILDRLPRPHAEVEWREVAGLYKNFLKVGST